VAAVAGLAVGELDPDDPSLLGQQRLHAAVRADLDLSGQRFIHAAQHVDAVLRPDVAYPGGDELQPCQPSLLAQLLPLGGEIAEEPVRGPVLDVEAVRLLEKIVEGFDVEEIAEIPAHLRGKGQLAVAVSPCAAPAAEHVARAAAAALPDAFPLLEKEDIPCAPFSQCQRRKDPRRPAADDDNLVLLHSGLPEGNVSTSRVVHGPCPRPVMEGPLAR